MTTAIYTLTSQLHDKAAVDAATQEFLESLGIEYQLMGDNFKDYGCHDLELIYVRTGGTEAGSLRSICSHASAGTGCS